jgi:hypothetical protein
MSNSIGDLRNSGLQGNNFPWQLKMLQGLQAIHDEVKLPLTCVEDSVTICSPTGGLDVNVHDALGNNITSTTIGADTGLDVNIIGGVTLEVNLDPNNDQVGIYGYTNPADPTSFTGIKVDANGELQVDVLTMPATFAEDTAHVSGNTGSFVLGVRNDLNVAMTNADGDYSPIAVNNNGAVAINDGGNTITVDATALDIRPLTCADEVSLCANGTTVNSGNPLPVDAGALTPSADGVGIYGSTDGGTNWTAVQVDTNGIVSTNTTIVGPTGPQNCVDSVAVTLCTQQAGVQITPNIQVSINDIATITDPVYSISFANIGTADALVSFDGGLNTVPLSPGVTVNMDAGGLGNFYASATFGWDTQSNLGSKLVITYNT